jgi:hypothetical protein
LFLLIFTGCKPPDGAQAECVQELIGAGCDVKATAQDETSALHFAAQTGRTAVCRLMLKAGAGPGAAHVLSHSEPTARHVRGDAEAAPCGLRTAGLKVNARTRRGFTPLHFAAKGGARPGPAPVCASRRTGAIAALMPSLLDPVAEATRAHSYTYAKQLHAHTLTRTLASAGHEEAVELLLARKANADATNRNEQTPLSLTTSAAVAALLQQALDARAAHPDPDPDPDADPTPGADADALDAAPAAAGPRAEPAAAADAAARAADAEPPAAGSRAAEAANGGEAARGAGGAQPRRDRPRHRKRRGGDGPDEYGFEPWRPPQFEQLLAAERAAAVPAADPAPAGPDAPRAAGASGPVPAAAAAAPVSTPGGEAQAAEPAGPGVPGGASALIGPPEAPKRAPGGAVAPGSAGSGAAVAAAGTDAAAAAAAAAPQAAPLPRKRPRVALAHLGDEEEGGEEED